MGVNCVKVHPEFNILVSASDDASIKLWDLDSGKFETSLKGHTAAVNHIAIDHSGRFIAVFFYFKYKIITNYFLKLNDLL